jgi:hypothetical protein
VAAQSGANELRRIVTDAYALCVTYPQLYK